MNFTKNKTGSVFCLILPRKSNPYSMCWQRDHYNTRPGHLLFNPLHILTVFCINPYIFALIYK